MPGCSSVSATAGTKPKQYSSNRMHTTLQQLVQVVVIVHHLALEETCKPLILSHVNLQVSDAIKHMHNTSDYQKVSHLSFFHLLHAMETRLVSFAKLRNPLESCYCLPPCMFACPLDLVTC